MNKTVRFMVSLTGMLVSVAMLVCATVSGILLDDNVSFCFLFICGFFPFLLFAFVAFRNRIRKRDQWSADRREGFLIVVLSWILAALLGAFPYFWGLRLFLYDAVFESVSGFTTTGISVIGTGTPQWQPVLRGFGIEEKIVNFLMSSQGCQAWLDVDLTNGISGIPPGLLLWRSVTNWLGGLGVIALFLAIMPLLSTGGQVLYNAETTGIQNAKTRITSRATSSAKIVQGIYLLLTIACALLLRYVCGINWFESICHAFTAISSGGFSTHTEGWRVICQDGGHLVRTTFVLAVFMGFQACNFALLYMTVVQWKWKTVLKNAEFRFFLQLSAISTAALFLGYHWIHRGSCVFKKEFSDALFLAMSTISGTGYDNNWGTFLPRSVVLLLYVVTVIGGCGGSTAGGMKCVRALLMCKIGIYEIKRCVSPHLMDNIRLDGILVEKETQRKSMMFILMFAGAIVIFAVIFAVCGAGLSSREAFDLSVGCLTNNSGLAVPGNGAYSHELKPWIKFLMNFEMLAGRLELYTIFILLLPSFWKR